MKCVTCGTEIDMQTRRADGTLRCPMCGTMYRRKTTIVQAPGKNGIREKEEKRSRKGRRRLRGVALGLALLVIAGLGAYHLLADRSGMPSTVISERKERKEIVALLRRLEKAYNEQDTYELLQLYDPTYTDAMFGLLRFFGIDGETMKSLMPFASQMIAESSTTDTGSIKIDLQDYTVFNTSGTVTYQVNFSFKNGEKAQLQETGEIVKINEVWYFTAFSNGGAGTSGAAPIPVNPSLTSADVEGRLYCVKGKKEDGAFGWGIINAQGTQIVAPYFKAIYEFDGNCFAVSLDGTNFGFIDRYGKLLTGYSFPVANGADAAGFYPVLDGGLYGLFNPSTGKYVPCQFQKVGRVNENGLFPAKKDAYWGIVDTDGNTRVDFIYDDMGEEIIRNRIGVSVNRAWGVVDDGGNIILPLSSENLRIWITKAGLIFAATSNQWDYFNSKVNLYGNDGSLLVPNILGNQYNSEPPMPVILTESEGGNRYLLIDEQGKIVADSLQILSDYRNTSLEKEDAKYIRMTQAENADYFIVEIYDKQINRIVMQVLDKNGRFILNNWIESNSYLTTFFSSNHEQWIMPSNYIFSDDGLWFLNVTDGQTKWTDIYSMPDGRYIAQIPYRVTNVYPYGNLLLCDSGSIIAADIDGNVVNSYQSASHCSDGLNRYAILFDGVYYGVLTESGFVGDGVSYSRVSYNQDERLFTLSKGANNESYRYNPDGSVIKIS